MNIKTLLKTSLTTSFVRSRLIFLGISTCIVCSCIWYGEFVRGQQKEQITNEETTIANLSQEETSLMQQIDKDQKIKPVFEKFISSHAWFKLTSSSRYDRDWMGEKIKEILANLPDMHADITIGKQYKMSALKNQPSELQALIPDLKIKDDFFAYEIQLVADILHEERVFALQHALEQALPGQLVWRGCNVLRVSEQSKIGHDHLKVTCQLFFVTGF